VRRSFPLFVAVLAVSASSAVGANSLPEVLTQEQPSFQVRPATISYTGDGTGVVGGPDGTSVRKPGHLKWTTYNHDVGIAVGRVWLNNCTPDCADGRFSPSRVQVRVSDPRDGHFRLLTLRYSYRGHRYVHRRVAHYYRGVATARGIWSYAICGIRYGPKC
jgi:hypothetical protein